MRHSTGSTSIGLCIWVAIGLAVATLISFPAGQAQSRERDRTLRLYFGHTGERAEFTFKRNGRYDRGEIRRLNHFLRDWRRDEDADMDPHLLDLIWSIYRETGSREYINVVSAYRSPTTNEQLRSRSNGVAKNSQHTRGKAMDFYIPGVDLAKLRGIAMRHQGGGVGYYPRSGSPFVHVDTGSVRSWPRMTRSQLLALFPNGETLYLPSDGGPLPGYERALARQQSQGSTALAYVDTEDTGDEGRGSGGGWLSRVFGGADETEDEAEIAQAPAAPAAPAAEPEVPVELADARLPRARPGTEVASVAAAADAPLPEVGIVVAEDRLAMASLADAPAPRGRPDAALLADSLADAAAPAALDIEAEDALAVLAARAQENLVIAAQTAETAAVAQVAATEIPTPPPTDGSALASFAANQEATAPETALAAVNAVGSEGQFIPRPRPMTLAFASAGLPAAEVQTPQVATPAPVEQAAAPAPAPAAEPSYQADAETLRLLIGTPATRDVQFAQFEMPVPSGAPGLYTAPESSASIGGLSEAQDLPVDRFEHASVSTEESFFSRLFASLVQ